MVNAERCVDDIGRKGEVKLASRWLATSSSSKNSARLSPHICF